MTEHSPTSRYIGAVLVVMALLNIAALAVGTAPLDLFSAFFTAVFGSSYGLAQVAFKATPLIFLGTAAAVSFSAGAFNIGGEGQAIAGCLGAALFGWAYGSLFESSLADHSWPVVAVGLIGCVLFAILAGGFLSFIAGYLRERFAAPEVMTTILLNFLGAALANYVVRRVAPHETSHTPDLAEGLRFSALGQSFEPLRGAQLTWWFAAAVATALLCDWLLFRTRFGFRLRALGENERAARLYGAATKHTVWLVFALSGGLAAMAGVHLVNGTKGYYEDGMTAGIGFVGIAVALLAHNKPRYVVVAALVIGMLQHSSLALSTLVPKEITDVVIAALLMALLWARKKPGAVS